VELDKCIRKIGNRYSNDPLPFLGEK